MKDIVTNKRKIPTDDAPYKSENLAILKFCCENYQNENGCIMRYLKTYHSPKEETNPLQEPMEEEIVEDRKSTRLNSSHITRSRMPSSA